MKEQPAKKYFWFNTDRVVSDLFITEYKKLCEESSLEKYKYLNKLSWVYKPDLVTLVEDAIASDNKEKYIPILKLFLQDGADDVCMQRGSMLNAFGVICRNLDQDLIKAYLEVVKEPKAFYSGIKASPLFIFIERLDTGNKTEIKECCGLISEESLSKQFDALPEDHKKYAGELFTVEPSSATMFVSLLDKGIEELFDADEVIPLGDETLPDGE